MMRHYVREGPPLRHLAALSTATVAGLRDPASPYTNCGSRAGRQIPSDRTAHQRSLRETPEGSVTAFGNSCQICQNGIDVKHHTADMNDDRIDVKHHIVDMSLSAVDADVNTTDVDVTVFDIVFDGGGADVNITDMVLNSGRVKLTLVDMKWHLEAAPLAHSEMQNDISAETVAALVGDATHESKEPTTNNSKE